MIVIWAAVVMYFAIPLFVVPVALQVTSNEVVELKQKDTTPGDKKLLQEKVEEMKEILK